MILAKRAYQEIDIPIYAEGAPAGQIGNFPGNPQWGRLYDRILSVTVRFPQREKPP